MEQAVLSVKDLSVGYREGDPVVQGMNLELAPGSYTVLSGASGCGKTTLLYALCGLLTSSFEGWQQGDIFVDGIDPQQSAEGELACHIACVWQQPDAQMCARTLFHEPGLPRDYQCKEMSQTDALTEELLEWVGLSHLNSDSDPLQLSGGEQQRLALAAALAQGAKVLVLDEPAAALDQQALEQFLQALSRIRDRTGVTVLAVDHRPEKHRGLAERFILLDQEGTIVYDGDYEEVLDAGGDLLRRHDVRASSGGSISGVINNVADSSASPVVATAIADGSEVVNAKGVFYQSSDGEMLLAPTDLCVRRGDVVALIGRNGSGKSTLLRCLVGMLTCGGVIVPGKKDRVESGIGWVAQRSSSVQLYGSVEATLVAAISRGRSESTAELSEQEHNAVLEIAKEFRLQDLLHRHPMRLSGGQRQRLNIGAALLSQPALLLLDEPTSAQDASGIASVVRALHEGRGSRGTIVVSHDREFLHQLHPTQTIELKLQAGSGLSESQAKKSSGREKDCLPLVHSLVLLLVAIAVWIAAARRTSLQELAVLAVVLFVFGLLGSIRRQGIAKFLLRCVLIAAFCVLSWVGFLPWVSDVQAQPWLNQQRMVGALLPAVQLSTLVLASVAVLPLVRGPELVDTLIGMLKVPYRFVDIALFGNRFMARIRRDMSFVQHQYRLTTRNAKRRIGLLRLVPVVTVASLRDSEQLADALDSRGFGASSTRTLRHYRPLTALDIAAGLGFFAFLLLLPSIAEFFWRLL